MKNKYINWKLRIIEDEIWRLEESKFLADINIKEQKKKQKELENKLKDDNE